MTEARPGTAADRSGRTLILVSMTVANAMVLVDQTAVPLALPSIMNEFRVGSQPVQWVLNASLLPLAGLLVLGGRLADLLGRRRVFVVGALIFAISSALAGLAPDFEILLTFRVFQGVGGALMLPTTIAIVSATFPDAERGRALGTMGGAAAVAGALGPTVGGALTATLGWRFVLLVNVPLAVVAVVIALRAIPPDTERTGSKSIDVVGTVLLSAALVGLIFGVAQSQTWGWGSPGVLAPLVGSVLAAVLFVRVERRSHNPLMDFALLRAYPNYRGAVISQGIGGMAEMGLGIIFPLFLILNLGMSPGLAGLALIPATLPMIVVAPLAGRWYDRVGGRTPLVTGFSVLAVSGLLLAVGVLDSNYWFLLPGLVVYGIGLALILTVNDPVSLDTVPPSEHGQASGVSATAEQFGGALGIAALYTVFHATYVNRLHANIESSPIADASDAQLEQLRAHILAAEQTGLHPGSFDPELSQFLIPALNASEFGYSVTFVIVSVLAVAGAVVVGRLVRPPPTPPADD